MRRIGLAAFLIWRESGDDFPKRCQKSRPLAFPKWKYNETTNQHLQNKTSLSTLIIIIIGRAEQWKGSSTALCSSNKLPGKKTKHKKLRSHAALRSRYGRLCGCRQTAKWLQPPHSVIMSHKKRDPVPCEGWTCHKQSCASHRPGFAPPPRNPHKLGLIILNIDRGSSIKASSRRKRDNRAEKGEVSAAISANCRIWNININWSIVYPNPRFDLMLKLWKYEPGNLTSIISCYLCVEHVMKELCLQETRLLFKWLCLAFRKKCKSMVPLYESGGDGPGNVSDGFSRTGTR